MAWCKRCSECKEKELCRIEIALSRRPRQPRRSDPPAALRVTLGGGGGDGQRLGEAVERYSASIWKRDEVVYARRDALDVPSLDPRELALYAPDQVPRPAVRALCRRCGNRLDAGLRAGSGAGDPRSGVGRADNRPRPLSFLVGFWVRDLVPHTITISGPRSLAHRSNPTSAIYSRSSVGTARGLGHALRYDPRPSLVRSAPARRSDSSFRQTPDTPRARISRSRKSSLNPLSA